MNSRRSLCPSTPHGLSHANDDSVVLFGDAGWLQSPLAAGVAAVREGLGLGGRDPITRPVHAKDPPGTPHAAIRALCLAAWARCWSPKGQGGAQDSGRERDAIPASHAPNLGPSLPPHFRFHCQPTTSNLGCAWMPRLALRDECFSLLIHCPQTTLISTTTTTTTTTPWRVNYPSAGGPSLQFPQARATQHLLAPAHQPPTDCISSSRTPEQEEHRPPPPPCHR